MEIGTIAPDFSLKDRTGAQRSLADIARKYTVVYFYPKDDTPGCTVEAVEFSSALPEFQELDAAVIGISGGDEKTKEKFCKKHDLAVMLLSDPDMSTAKAYGAYGERSFMGRKYMGILRHTFLLDSQLRIIRIYRDVKPAGHAAEVLEAIRLSG